MADTELDEQMYKGFDLTEYSEPDKVKALIESLGLDPDRDIITEDSDNSYEINARKVKHGSSPEKYKRVVEAFKKLLTPKQRDKINSYLKLLGTFEEGCTVRDKIYKEVSKGLEKKKSDMRPEIQESIKICETDCMYVQNILYHLLWIPSSYEKTEPDYVKAYREAWFGREVVDRRSYSHDNDGSYKVFTDEEADEAARNYIEDSLWAFNPDFIISHSKALDFDKGSTEILKAIQNQCEGGNDAVRRLIDDMDEFVEDAISADGRGHFLNMYDGNEDEVKIDDTYYYIYRE